MTETVETTTGGRHAGREVALQVLYALDLAETGPRDANAARAARVEEAPGPPAGPRALVEQGAAAGSAEPREKETAGDTRSADLATRSPARVAALSRGANRSGTIVAPRRALERALATSSDSTAASPDLESFESTEFEHPDPERLPGPSAVEASALAFDRVAENFSVPGAAVAFARALVVGVSARTSELDELVGQHARNWRVSRMAAVDRNVLRLAVYELRETETPIAVVIDEAVDLARRFGSDTSPSFVNGILDAVAREVRRT